MESLKFNDQVCLTSVKIFTTQLEVMYATGMVLEHQTWRVVQPKPPSHKRWCEEYQARIQEAAQLLQTKSEGKIANN